MEVRSQATAGKSNGCCCNIIQTVGWLKINSHYPTKIIVPQLGKKKTVLQNYDFIPKRKQLGSTKIILHSPTIFSWKTVQKWIFWPIKFSVFPQGQIFLGHIPEIPQSVCLSTQKMTSEQIRNCIQIKTFDHLFIPFLLHKACGPTSSIFILYSKIIFYYFSLTYGGQLTKSNFY